MQQRETAAVPKLVLSTGDRLLRNPGSSLKDGQTISLVAAPAPAQAKPSAAASGL